MHRLCFFFFLLLSFILLCTPSRADNVATMPAAGASPQAFIFAYPGKVCPGGSTATKGPEQTLAAASGAVYCRFARTVFPIFKRNSSTCPPGTKPHSEANAKPGADVIWCENDPNAKLIIPPPPAQPPKQSPP
jgi:hypothetical protein